MAVKQTILAFIAKSVLSLYYGVRWKVRYLTKVLGIENTKEKLQEAWEYDQARFLRYSVTRLNHEWPFAAEDSDELTKGHLQSILIKNYHTIEKAMALPAPRPGFGQKTGVIDKCIQDCETYIRRHGKDSVTHTTFDVLSEYRDRFAPDYAPVNGFLTRYRELDDQCKTGGTVAIKSKDIFVDMGDSSRLFKTRHSIRNYSGVPVQKELIEKAVDYAMRGTPSVCNRQPGKVYVFSTPEEKANLLRLQNGNKGFGDSASHILVVTSSLESFVDIGERNQCWISGGMFAMSLVYALHSMKVATCTLNWDVLPENDKALHALADIPESEVIVMMMAIGNYPEELRIAMSERKELSDVLHFRS